MKEMTGTERSNDNQGINKSRIPSDRFNRKAVMDAAARETVAAYLKKKRGFILVSHDRFFLDRTAQILYELYDRKLTKYP